MTVPAKTGVISVILADSQALYRVGVSKIFDLNIGPEIKIVVQSAAADQGQTVELYRRGIRGIISRSISPDLLVRRVRHVAAGETWIDNQALHWVLEACRVREAELLSPHAQLRFSPKQTIIIACVTRGMRNKEIAFEVGTLSRPSELPPRKIYEKLGLSDRLELTLDCIDNKIITEEADQAAVVQKSLNR